MPSTPRLSTPLFSTTSSPVAASRIGVVMLTTVRNAAMSEIEGHARAAAGLAPAPIDAQAPAHQHVAGEDEEQHHRLEDAGRRARHMHRGLRHLPADIGDRQHDARQHDADRMQPAEERDDDRGEAVARGKAEVELARLRRRLQHAGEPRHRAGDQQRRPDRVGGAIAGVARGLGRLADDAHAQAELGARHHQPEHAAPARRRCRGRAGTAGRTDWPAAAGRRVNGAVCGKVLAVRVLPRAGRRDS